MRVRASANTNRIPRPRPNLNPNPGQVSGLQLFDTVSEQLHEVGPLADVFVTQRDATCEVLK